MKLILTALNILQVKKVIFEPALMGMNLIFQSIRFTRLSIPWSMPAGTGNAHRLQINNIIPNWVMAERTKWSKAWLNFTKKYDNSAGCNVCKVITDGNTSNIVKHHTHTTWDLPPCSECSTEVQYRCYCYWKVRCYKKATSLLFCLLEGGAATICRHCQ